MNSGLRDEAPAVRRAAVLHPIGVVAARTGLTPDVLRVWERRYGVVRPERTATGQRLYTEADVERLRLLGRATAHGRSIGQLLALSADELRELVRGDEAATLQPRRGVGPQDASGYVALALERALRLDASGLEALLRRLAGLWGTPSFVEQLAAPLMRSVGEEWHAGRLTSAHEHLATAVMRSVLTSLRADLAPPTQAPAVVLATPAGERHEVGALLAAAVAAAEGWRVIYLGPDLPAAEIAGAVLETSARAVGVSIVRTDDAEPLHELRCLREALPAHVCVVAGGRGASARAAEPGDDGVSVFTDLDSFRVWLRAP